MDTRTVLRDDVRTPMNLRLGGGGGGEGSLLPHHLRPSSRVAPAPKQPGDSFRLPWTTVSPTFGA